MENNQTHSGNEKYDKKFFNYQNASSDTAEVVLSVISKFIRPSSVIDVGCGVGSWLAAWQKIYAAEIYGIDGDYVDRSQLFIDKKFFHSANLEERVTLERRFDLAMTLEVGEHLSPARADSFVEDLTKLSDVILFSAAIPGQGGTNHVNEQWQSYWAEKFLQLDYVGIDCIRSEIWDNVAVGICYRQNVFVYVKNTELYRYPELQEFYLSHRDSTIFNLVHPGLYVIKLMECMNIYKRFQKYLAETEEH